MKRIVLFFVLAFTISLVSKSKDMKMPDSSLYKDIYLLVGTYTNSGSKGIYVYKFNVNSGQLTFVSSTDMIINPSYLAVSGKYIFSVNETKGAKPGKISSFLFNKKTGKLSFINDQPSGGDNPCYLSISADGKWLSVANYFGGNLSLFSINSDGSLSPYIQLIQHQGKGANLKRQEMPHVHETVFSPDGNYLVVPDLGLDKVMIYKFDPNSMPPLAPSSSPFVKSTSGSGPRHITFSKDGKFAYVIHELSNMITAYEYHNGVLSFIEEIKIISDKPSSEVGGGEILVSPDGKFLYASLRGEVNALSIFSINKSTGRLKRVDDQSTLGKEPRSFVIDPSGKFLLVANQESNNIMVFKRNVQTGLLSRTSQGINIPKPAYLQLIPRN